MSRDLDIEHPTSRKAAADHGRDLHADRAPYRQPSRTTSMTGTRVAEAPPKSKAEAAAAAKHTEAEDTSFDGIQAALAYGAASIHRKARTIDALIKDPGDRGPSVAIEEFSKIFGSVDSLLTRLSLEASSQANNAVRLKLAKEAQQLAGAFEVFSEACDRARGYAAVHQGQFEKNPWHLKPYIENIYRHIGLDKDAASNRIADPRTDAELLKQTIRNNLAAAGKCADAARMGMATGGAKVEEDTKKLLAHLRELDVVLRDEPAAVRGFEKQLHDMLATIRTFRQSASQPMIGELIKSWDGDGMIDRLTKKAG